MRIIAGKYKGTKLIEFDIHSTRPTLDKVREAIFDVIHFDIPDKDVVDLFAGTGALGIEALSRGAGRVTFVDMNKKACAVVKQNLDKVKYQSDVLNMDSLKYLSTTTPHDIYLIDAPYASGLGDKAVRYVLENNLLADGGIIVYERSADSPDVDYGYRTKTKRYGTVKVDFIYKE